jgi:hypothetical protein
MPIDVDLAERFILSNARLLERHRTAVLLHGAPAAPVLDALRAYRNPDGGFGHALEPDVRGPESEPASALHALEVLAEVGELADPLTAGATSFIAGIAGPDGGVPFVMPASADAPHAPWMRPTDGGSQLTFAIAALLFHADSDDPWLARATEWCWTALARPEALGGYLVKFGLAFLDAVPDEARAVAAIDRLRPLLDADGSLPVPDGVDDERLMPLSLSPRPGARSRALFTAQQIEHDLDRIEREQQDDGGWTFDWLGWSEGQSVEWRGIVTLLALATLAAHGRIAGPRPAP